MCWIAADRPAEQLRMTTTVVFYYLERPAHNGKLRLTCNLANTAFKRGHKIYLSANSDQMCRLLDDMLWTFAPNSFVPHVIDDRDNPFDLEQFPVVIGHDKPSEDFNDVLISLNQEVPEYARQFRRVMEPVDSSEQDVTFANRRFSRYTEIFGTEPTKHML